MSLRIEGYAIISEDGMLADANGVMPPSLVIDADQKFLSDRLDQAVLIVHGRNSHENQPLSPYRRRLIASRSVATLGPAPEHPNALLWNPEGLPIAKAADALDIEAGTVAILGGTSLFGHFLPYYDVFHLSRAAGVRLPGGRPVFPQVPDREPEAVLAASGLVADTAHTLDAARGATLVSWRRARAI
jgi:dihydrofolate reductase